MTPETTTANTSKPRGPRRPKPRGIWIAIKSAASLTLRAVEFGFYHVLFSTVDRVSRLPRNTTMPEAARLYRENIALKAQLDALEAELARAPEPAPVPIATRAAQVFAYLLTRGDEPFQRYFLSASLRTLQPAQPPRVRRCSRSRGWCESIERVPLRALRTGW